MKSSAKKIAEDIAAIFIVIAAFSLLLAAIIAYGPGVVSFFLAASTSMRLFTIGGICFLVGVIVAYIAGGRTATPEEIADRIIFEMTIEREAAKIVMQKLDDLKRKM